MIAMRMLIFIPPKDFQDETLSMLKLFFDKWGIEYALTSYAKGECVGKHGAVVKPDLHASTADSSEYDGIIIVNGDGIDEYKLYEFRPLLDMLLLFDKNAKQIWAIGNGIKVVARANVVKGRKLAVDKNAETLRLVSLFHGEPSNADFEIDRNIVSIKAAADLETSIHSVLRELNVK